MARRARPSITDVAARAGVAVGTVSNVLNRPGSVSEATRERVQAAIRELAYVPNGVARSLRVGRSTTVGLVVLDIRNPFFTEVARGAEDRLAADGCTLMLASSDDDPVREATYLRLLAEQEVLGLLVVPTSADPTELLEVVERGGRVVVVDAPSPDPALSSVAVDDRAGGALATRHLLDLGHRRIAVLNGVHIIRQCRDRWEGAHAEVEAAGLDPDEVLVEVVLPTRDARAGDDAVTRLLADGALPAALFAVNDLVAIGAQRALRRAPDTSLLGRTALVGYDDIDVAAELALPLTSVHQPAYDVGHRATELLLAAAADPDAPAQHVLFQPELVVRATSVPAV